MGQYCQRLKFFHATALYKDTLFLFHVWSSRYFSSLWYIHTKTWKFLPSPALRYLTTSHSNFDSPATAFKYSTVRFHFPCLSFSPIHLAPYYVDSACIPRSSRVQHKRKFAVHASLIPRPRCWIFAATVFVWNSNPSIDHYLVPLPIILKTSLAKLGKHRVRNLTAASVSSSRIMCQTRNGKTEELLSLELVRMHFIWRH